VTALIFQPSTKGAPARAWVNRNCSQIREQLTSASRVRVGEPGHKFMSKVESSASRVRVGEPDQIRIAVRILWGSIKSAARCRFEAKRMYVAAALEIGERRAAPTLLSAWSLGVTAPSHQLTKPRTLAVPLIAVSGSLCGSVALSLWCP